MRKIGLKNKEKWAYPRNGFIIPRSVFEFKKKCSVFLILKFVLTYLDQFFGHYMEIHNILSHRVLHYIKGANDFFCILKNGSFWFFVRGKSKLDKFQSFWELESFSNEAFMWIIFHHTESYSEFIWIFLYHEKTRHFRWKAFFWSIFAIYLFFKVP